ncbi:F420-dependent oxidoreductase-like protein [Kibdelosporangium banguiense]|uniref:F420-dependent oxidoreductase-like protein n=1 Tax=Kibdelosporangium banguiense TaxID=1365924 RepID=A0ABS4TWZ7_9PSEU|nr:TIGR03564 family F420-dependent LLM class oxidoreductase [Kibdelosporangium banguiense]MBP2328936.1 F420-dependent oxidoreductase-like protein [Kibdelosporangium banguiense]
MRLGIQARLSGQTGNVIDDLLEHARVTERHGLDLWIGQGLDVDSVTALTIAAREAPALSVGVSVVPAYSRHPVNTAVQALTAQAATGGRFTLGVGVSHQIMVEGVYGISYTKQLRQMREYLEILMPLLHGHQIDYTGEVFSAHTTRSPVAVPGATPPRVLVAAMGTRMLELTGQLADGTTLWMVGPKTLADHVVPTITKAADAADRPTPEVMAGLTVCVTSDPDTARAVAGREFAIYKSLPAYQAMFEREGAGGAEDLTVVGDEEQVAEQIRRLEDLGATSAMFAVYGTDEEQHRTLALLSELARSN